MFLTKYWPISLIAGLYVLNWFRKRYQKSHCELIARRRAQAKRTARDRRREELLSFIRTKYAKNLPERAIADRIAQSTAVELLDGIHNKDFTHTQVMLVLSLRAIKIGQQLNCTTEEFFDQALAYAEKLDEDNTDQQELLLRGIPISLKDQIDQQGADSSMGIAMRNFRPAAADGLIVQLLKAQGAFPGFVRSATIQGMMLPDTESQTYGVANNPYDSTRTTGGSSGGEGALIGARGSPIGIGTDIGGSIRIPAHFCGVFGFKPTPGRIAYVGISSPSLKDQSGESNIRATCGPLARCTDDLVLVMRSLMQELMWKQSPETPRQPWRDDVFQDKKKLTIGFYTDDTWFSPAPACIRAVNEAADTLRKLGHRVVPYTPIDLPEAVRLFVGIIGADGSRKFMESLENEEINSLYVPLFQAALLPNFLRPLVAFFLRLLGERRSALIVQSVGPKTVYEYFDLIMDMKIYVKKWLADLKANNIDLLLTPANGLPAYRHGQSGHLFHSCSYTFLFNLLHFPCGIVPMTVVRDDEQYYEGTNPLYNDRATSLAKDVCRQSAGLPIGVQLCGLPNDDERVLNVMKQLETAIGKEQLPIPHFAKTLDIYTD